MKETDDRIINKFNEVVKDYSKFDMLTKEDVMCIHLGKQLMVAGVNPLFKKTYLIEDVKAWINNKNTVRCTKELYDKIMKFKDGTVVMVTKEIHRGTILYDVDDVEKLCADVFATDKKTKTTTDKLITVTKYEYDVNSATGKVITENEGKIEVNPKYITYTEPTFKFGKNGRYIVNPDYWIINIAPDNHIIVNKKDHNILVKEQKR